MCGITGFFHIHPGPEAQPDRLQKMCDAIVHRGPDSDGMLCQDGVAIGMRRLKIIDLKSGDQPIFNHDRSVVVTFNGRTLMRQRQGGGSFLSESDFRLHFGLGDADRIERLEVHWPSRTVDVLTDLAADQMITITEGQTGP